MLLTVALRYPRAFLLQGVQLRAQVLHDTEVAERVLARELAKIKPWEGTSDEGEGARTY